MNVVPKKQKAESDDNSWKERVWAIALPVIQVCVLAILGYLQARTNSSIDDAVVSAKKSAIEASAKVEEAAVKVEAVKETLDESTKRTDTKLDGLAGVANSTHILVNNNMAIQLKLNAELSRWKATQTGKPEDEKAALLAERLVAEHEAKQKTVDDLK